VACRTLPLFPSLSLLMHTLRWSLAEDRSPVDTQGGLRRGTHQSTERGQFSFPDALGRVGYLVGLAAGKETMRVIKQAVPNKR
jgi:hypothetical protein